MEQHDLNQIKQIVDESIDTKVKPLIDLAIDTKVKPLIDESIEDLAEKTIKPSFDEVYNRLDKVEGRLDKLETKVNTLPDKDYLDHKLAELKGDSTVKFRKYERKIEILTESQKRKGMLKNDELEELKGLKIFPTLQDLKPVM